MGVITPTVRSATMAAKSGALPLPMLAVAAADLPPEDGGWAYEMKWDG